MKTITLLGIIAGIGLILASFLVFVPSREIYNPKPYIGGDAYNYQIEASIRAGEIAGAKTAKAVYLIGGMIIFFGSLIAFEFSNESSKSQKYSSSSRSNYGVTEYKNPTDEPNDNTESKKCKSCSIRVSIDKSRCPKCGGSDFLYS